MAGSAQTLPLDAYNLLDETPQPFAVRTTRVEWSWIKWAAERNNRTMAEFARHALEDWLDPSIQAERTVLMPPVHNVKKSLVLPRSTMALTETTPLFDQAGRRIILNRSDLAISAVLSFAQNVVDEWKDARPVNRIADIARPTLPIRLAAS